MCNPMEGLCVIAPHSEGETEDDLGIGGFNETRGL